jgi:hypothetical protein
MDTENKDLKDTHINHKYLHLAGKFFTDTGRYAFFMALVLMGVWLVGRILEAITQKTVFDPNLVYWMGVSMWILLGVFVLGTAVSYIRELSGCMDKRHLILSWFSFGVVVAATLYISQGYRIASKGLFAIMSGLTESASQTFFLLFKFYPVTPTLPINFAASKASGVGLEINSLMPLVLSSSAIFIFFVWSLVYGTLLLKMPGNKFFKIVHLSLSLAGLVILMMVKTMFSLTMEQHIYLQVGAVILVFMQVILTYSSLRFAATNKNNETQENIPMPLPPSAFKVAFVLLVILPILADFQNQYVLASSIKPIMRELANDQLNGQETYVTAADISVHSGPATGDDVLGILPKGAQVHVLKKKYGWICIGPNKWVSSKFLRAEKM